MNSKIIPNISNFNFDYRVVRHVNVTSDGRAIIIDGELDTYLKIHEIHFGADGEIVAYIKEPECPYGDDLEGMTYELLEYMEALKKPILNFEFVKDQTKRSSRRMKRRYKKDMEPECDIEQASKSFKDYEKGEGDFVSWDEVKEKHGWIDPVFEYIPVKEAIEKFEMNKFKNEEVEQIMYTVFELEKCLIPFNDWENHYKYLPDDKFIMLRDYNPQDEGPIGLGHHTIVGYFILASGQGPFLVWAEHEEFVEKN
jgi:hypothetical protein